MLDTDYRRLILMGFVDRVDRSAIPRPGAGSYSGFDCRTCSSDKEVIGRAFALAVQLKLPVQIDDPDGVLCTPLHRALAQLVADNIVHTEQHCDGMDRYVAYVVGRIAREEIASRLRSDSCYARVNFGALLHQDVGILGYARILAELGTVTEKTVSREQLLLAYRLRVAPAQEASYLQVARNFLTGLGIILEPV